MGRKLQYRPGSFYRVDDRTGFPERAENTRKQWDGLIVANNVWEPRQPQNLVRGVKDQQSVPDARPDAPNRFVGPIFIPISQAAAIGATHIYVSYTLGLNIGHKVGVMMDNGIEFMTKLLSIDSSGAFIIIKNALPYTAASGNLVCDYGVAA